MNAVQKLEILSSDSQYDLACACGTAKGDTRKRSVDGCRWLYPVPAASGGKGILFKTLMSNCCANDCKYCPLRSNSDTAARCSLSPDETAHLFMEQNRRRFLMGLFLSSGVTGSADHTMERLVASAEILRKRYQYRGYIHLKIIPGASGAAMDEAMRYASAVSLNIEVPGRRHFEKLSGCKNFDRDIAAPLRYLAEKTGKGGPFKRVRCSTQFIVGASDETDLEILRYMDGIYKRLHFQRVFFSAYQAGLGDAAIPGEQAFSLRADLRLTREHRLYQTDFLLRKYKFDAREILFDRTGNLDLQTDPKMIWAQAHPEFFPVKLNSANKKDLLHVPGLGPVSVARIEKARTLHSLRSLADAGLRGALARKAEPYLVFS